ncbi:MAG: hypothetical protein A2Y62_00205 [Candidatus Fischerbacteria bacterium RBG_13_37_8]|uniref:PTS EIIA type-2 domain-containing protein n=1 Tax=Candidatus Fischerbacteria bacterium RBG_13_37_8 TaxID=1817863 RepID=A0A1F5VRJ5_9BACT|nr:MAG: hypothetical protein A2Y62_00205 [Candidatus Fischerbacteria bacterium RBG_13_37_8]
MVEFNAPTREGALNALVHHLLKLKLIENDEELYQKLLEREMMESTAIENNVAIPHCKLEKLKNPVILLGISRQGVNFLSIEKKPTHVFFLVISPADFPALHLKVLASVAKIAKSKDLMKKIIAEKDYSRIKQLIKEEEENQILKSP